VSSWKLKRHQETHSYQPKPQTSNASYPCRWCGILFDKLNNRASHEKRIHKTKPNSGLDNFKCTDCSAIFKTRDELRDHSFEHFSGKIHFCDFPTCSRYFKKGKLLTVHKRCHYEPQYKCLDCGQMFIQRPGLIKHQKERCPTKKTKIEEPTEEELDRLAALAKSQYINLNGKMFCTSKGYVVTNRRKKKKNVFNKSENESDLMKDDTKSVMDEIKKNEDMVQVEIKEEECWEYEFLEDPVDSFEKKNFQECILTNLESDMIILTDEPKSSKSASKKGRKPGVHRDVKAINLKRNCRFTCDYCGVADLTSKVQLQKHLNIHRKEYSKKTSNTYHCDINQCSEVFTNISSFITHKRSVHGLKVGHRSQDPFVCPICQKTFYSRSSIKSHMEVTHKDVADYNCTQCYRKFKTRSNLERHVKSVHENHKPWGCEKCGKMFKEKYKLEIHLHNHDERKYKCKMS
jgi:KRAB domain-containing zinc finger protein